MRVIVPIKQIRDPKGIRVNLRRERVELDEAELIISPNDKNALEEALRLKESQGAEVIAISIGGPEADDALREALAMGVDRAVLLADEAFSRADAYVATVVLSKAVEKLAPYDLILVGREAADTGGGELGPRLAASLDIPHVTDVRELRLAEGKAVVRRGWGQGYAEMEVDLPALLAIAPEANRPRYPSAPGIIAAYEEGEVQTWSAADLGLSQEELEPLVEERGLRFPPQRKLGEEIIRGTPEEAARELARILKHRHLI